MERILTRQHYDTEAQAIILAAGYGRRMRPLTNHIHKTLLRIGVRTVLQMIVDSLLEFGIERITIVTGYRENEVRAYLADTYPSIRFNYIYNERYEQTNNIYSMALALESVPLDADVILIESDLIYEPAVIERLLRSKGKNIALVDRWRPGMDGTVVAVEPGEHVITSIIPPHLQGTGFDFSDKYKTLNIYRFSKAFCNNILKRILSYYAKAINDNCYYELILGVLIYMNDVKIHAEILEGEKWTEIDDPNDLDIARFMFDPSAERQLLDTSFGGYWRYDITDFRFIRNMYFPTGAIISELKNNLPGLLHNYGSRQGLLDRKLATFLLLDSAERVTALNGLSQAFPSVASYLGGKRVLIPTPTFGEYHRLFPEAETYADMVGIDTKALSDRIRGCDAVVIVNPNNPTGSLLPTSWIYEAAASHPDVTFVVDESFAGFSGEEGLLPMLEAKPLDNVLLLMSLSKVLGVPGLRLGYTYSASNAFNKYLRARVPIWNMNSMAEFFLEVILKHRDALKRSIAQTIADRQKFEAQLRKLPMVTKVHQSGGNYILVSFDCSPAKLDRLIEVLLRQHRIYVKDTSEKLDLPGSHVRLAVRTADENRRFVSCFRQALASVERTANHRLAAWQVVWNKQQPDAGTASVLDRLIAVDGFRSVFGGMTSDTWTRYLETVAAKLAIEPGDSIFEVGCGAGALLYPFFLKQHPVSGVDYAGSLVSIAREVMPGARILENEAIQMPADEQVDYVVSNSVFQYFPDLEYTATVLKKMSRIAAKGIGVLDVPDAVKMADAINYRRGKMGVEEYERNYKNLDHLYFDRSWFTRMLADDEFDVLIEDQAIPGYGNNEFRFNVFITRRAI